MIGAALPLTGELAALGAAQREGAERAVARVNEDGGLDVGGTRRPVELAVRDTGSVAEAAAQFALILVRGPEEVVALLGPCTPPLSLVRVAEARLVPLLTGCQPLPAAGLHHTWQVGPTEDARAAAVFTALADAGPARRTALLLSNERAEQPWSAAAAGAGFSVVSTGRPTGADWAGAVAQAAAAGADVVVAVTRSPEGARLWAELDRQDLEPRSAYVSEAGLGSPWYAAVGRDGDGVLTDDVHPPTTAGRQGPGPARADLAVTAVSDELATALLEAVAAAGSTGRGAVNAQLATAATPAPARLAQWRDGELVPVR